LLITTNFEPWRLPALPTKRVAIPATRKELLGLNARRVRFQQDTDQNAIEDQSSMPPALITSRKELGCRITAKEKKSNPTHHRRLKHEFAILNENKCIIDTKDNIHNQ
jgi:hypothetical protein